MTVVASNYARKENDLYQTEPWATRALLNHIGPMTNRFVWEPSAGNHLMVDVLKEDGAIVRTSDIATYDREHDMIIDFLDPNLKCDHPCKPALIITNPPYGKGNRDAAKYARLALQRCEGWVALLLTAKFDFGKTRTDLFRDNERFWGKIALLDRIQWFPGETSGTEDHAWYIWAPSRSYRHSARASMMFWEGREGNE